MCEKANPGIEFPPPSPLHTPSNSRLLPLPPRGKGGFFPPSASLSALCLFALGSDRRRCKKERFQERRISPRPHTHTKTNSPTLRRKYFIYFVVFDAKPPCERPGWSALLLERPFASAPASARFRRPGFAAKVASIGRPRGQQGMRCNICQKHIFKADIYGLSLVF